MYVHNLYIGFQAACDIIWRKEMWSEMHEIGCLQKHFLNCAEF